MAKKHVQIVVMYDKLDLKLAFKCFGNYPGNVDCFHFHL